MKRHMKRNEAKVKLVSYDDDFYYIRLFNKPSLKIARRGNVWTPLFAYAAALASILGWDELLIMCAGKNYDDPYKREKRSVYDYHRRDR